MLVQIREGDAGLNLFNFISIFSLLSYVLLGYVCLFRLRFYKKLSYYGYQEILSVVKILSLSNLLYMIYFLLFLREQWPIILLPTLWLTSIVFITGSHLIWTMAKKIFFPQDVSQQRILIIGAGEAGTITAQQILQSEGINHNLIGFIDDDSEKQNLKVLGIPVLGKKADIQNLIKLYEITDVIIAMPSAARTEILGFVNICKKTTANVKLLPDVKDWIGDQMNLNEIRNLNIKDLIGREMIEPTHRINDYLRNVSVLITGAGGSIGSELANQVASFDPQRLILLGHGENSIFNVKATLEKKFPHIELHFIIADIQDQQHIEHVFLQFKPDIVFHAAAHKHVPLMERNEGAAVRNNIFGTENVVKAADRFGVKRFVFISTDKAVHPVNTMGMTKRIGEMIVQSTSEKSSTKFSVVRFGNVLESRGSVIPIFKKQIESGGPVTVTHPEMVRYFMTIPEAVQLVLEAGALSKGGEVFVLDMGEPVKILDIAQNLIRLSGYEPERDIRIEYIGIRPGEKLSEVLFYDSEEMKTTDHPHVLIAIPRKNNNVHLEHYLEELKQAMLNNPEQLQSILTYIIQNDVAGRI
ncbi:polysaccharide biosynthesis protein [Ectobacillus funiculus]